MKRSTTFQTTVRSVPLHIEATVTGDQYGIYHIDITAYLDGADVTGLLTDDDVMQLDSEVLTALQSEHSEDLTTKGY